MGVELEIEADKVWMFLEHIEIVIGLVCAFVSLAVAVYKKRVQIASPITRRIEARKQRKVKELFEDLKPLLEVEMNSCMEQQKDMLEQHGITLKHTAAENVEFRQYVNTSMDKICKSMDKITVLILSNTEKYDKLISIKSLKCVETEECCGKDCPLYDKCTLDIKK